ncbi:WD-repeat protein, partial [Reticulomyxa filosa]
EESRQLKIENEQLKWKVQSNEQENGDNISNLMNENAVLKHQLLQCQQQITQSDSYLVCPKMKLYCTQKKLAEIEQLTEELKAKKEELKKWKREIPRKDNRHLNKEDEDKIAQDNSQEEMAEHSNAKLPKKRVIKKKDQLLEQNKKLLKLLKENYANVNRGDDHKEYNGDNDKVLMSTSEHIHSFPFELVCTFKLIKTFSGHNGCVNSIDYSTFDGGQFLCSGSDDKTIRVWDTDAAKQIKLLNGHDEYVNCVKFSLYHYYNNRRMVICSASDDKTIRFWNFETEKTMQVFTGHDKGILSIQFSSFGGGRYSCYASFDKTIRLWYVETSKSLHVFKGHTVGCKEN